MSRVLVSTFLLKKAVMEGEGEEVLFLELPCKPSDFFIRDIIYGDEIRTCKISTGSSENCQYDFILNHI